MMENPIGMIVYKFSNKPKIKHIANIYGFYVNERYRGKGVGAMLIKNALNTIRKNKNIIKVNLNVNPMQKAAVKLYKKHGFKIAGRLKNDLFVNGKFYDELVLEKFL